MADSKSLQLPAIDPSGLEVHGGTFYPDEMKGRSEARAKQRLGDACGLTKFGVNKTVIPPGASSALRHWHQNEDEFIYVLEGEVTIVSDVGAQVLTPGMAAGFPASKPDGHYYANEGTEPAVVLEVGNRVSEDDVFYPDDDLMLKKRPGNHQYFNKAGEPLGDIVANSPRPAGEK